jgi:hypothetical protein
MCGVQDISISHNLLLNRERRCDPDEQFGALPDEQFGALLDGDERTLAFSGATESLRKSPRDHEHRRTKASFRTPDLLTYPLAELFDSQVFSAESDDGLVGSDEAAG